MKIEDFPIWELYVTQNSAYTTGPILIKFIDINRVYYGLSNGVSQPALLMHPSMLLAIKHKKYEFFSNWPTLGPDMTHTEDINPHVSYINRKVEALAIPSKSYFKNVGLVFEQSRLN